MPTQSRLEPYSQLEPGSKTNGVEMRCSKGRALRSRLSPRESRQRVRIGVEASEPRPELWVSKRLGLSILPG